MTIILKIVIGDYAGGKASLLCCYEKDATSTEYDPLASKNIVAKTNVNGKDVNLQILDTTGQKDLKNIRILSYASTDVFLLCFSISEPTSFSSIQSKLMPELKRYVTKSAIVLVMAKSELREDESIVQNLSEQNQKTITKEQG
jgi:small GTP-binding protein